MRNLFHIRFVYVLVFLAFSCEKISLLEAEAEVFNNLPWEQVQSEIDEHGFRSEQRYRPSSMSEDVYQGAINAVKKAYQLTDISFTPLCPIDYNTGTYHADSTYTGMIYSSVKEIGTFVGSNVTFYTFMTAIHNPRSRVYTERIDESPYYGSNCRAYYGTVCSGLVSYALGLFPIHASYDFVASDEMEELSISDIDGFHIADVLWRPGHVALITDLIRDSNERIVYIEISEAVKSGCLRNVLSRTAFWESHFRSFKRVFRYRHLERNIQYISVPEFVPVFDEAVAPFAYNNDICVDKGDQSCYFVGEDVVLNILSSGDFVEIYKDGVHFSSIDVESEDIRLTDLEYGEYQARVVAGDRCSDFTSWIMVDYLLVPSSGEMKLYFKSINSKPSAIIFCDKSGGRNFPIPETICRKITEDEIINGFIIIEREKLKSSRPYFSMSFATDFGMISSIPLQWK